MKTILWLLIGPLLFGSLLPRSATAAEKPNIIFILADDLGAHDLGCCDSTFYETPNLDRLARDGARISRARLAVGGDHQRVTRLAFELQPVRVE